MCWKNGLFNQRGIKGEDVPRPPESFVNLMRSLGGICPWGTSDW